MPAIFEVAAAANTYERPANRGKKRLFFPRAKLKAFTRFYAHSIRNYSLAPDAQFRCLQEASDRCGQQFSTEDYASSLLRARSDGHACTCPS